MNEAVRVSGGGYSAHNRPGMSGMSSGEADCRSEMEVPMRRLRKLAQVLLAPPTVVNLQWALGVRGGQ